MSAFNTGTPGSSAPAPGNIFAGASGTTAGTPKFSFGSAGGSSAAPSNNAGTLFGEQGNSSTPKLGEGPFGSASGTPSSAGGGLFGAKPAGQSSAPAFGGGSTPTTTSAGASAPASGGLFGGASASAAPTSGGLFGSSGGSADKAASNPFGGAASGGGGLFGRSNTTTQGTAAAPTSSAPATGLFANSGNSLFANKAGADSSAQGAAPTMASSTTPAKPMFSLASTTPAGAPPVETSKPAGLNLFQTTGGQQSGTGSGLFGAVSASNAQPLSAPAQLGGSRSGNALGGMFGAKPPTTSATGASGMFASVGTPSSQAPPSTQAGASGASALFGAKPATPTTSAPAPSSAGLFGGAATTAPTSSAAPAAAAAPAGGFFGNKTSATTSSTAAPATTSSGNGLFAQSSSAPATAKPTMASLFGAALGATSQPASTSAAPAAATSTSAAGGAGGLFGASTAAATDSAAKGQETDTSKPAGQNGVTSTLGASTTGPTSQIARLKNKTMEDIVTRWASDLSKYQKEFKDQATVVSTWDRDLVDNGEKIQKLYLDTFEAERASHEIERQLAAVESQQDELEAWLDRYESEVQDMFAKQIGPGEQLAGPDQERERTYKLAEKLTQQLDEKSRDLSKMVKEINDISGTLSKGAKPEDPLSQIVRVLNGHLTQLQWIDANASALQAKVAAAQKSSNTLGSHYAGSDNDAAESFYRSYMGRR